MRHDCRGRIVRVAGRHGEQPLGVVRPDSNDSEQGPAPRNPFPSIVLDALEPRLELITIRDAVDVVLVVSRGPQRVADDLLDLVHGDCVAQEQGGGRCFHGSPFDRRRPCEYQPFILQYSFLFFQS